MRMSGIDYSDQPEEQRRISVHLLVTNTSDKALAITPSQFAIATPSGKVLSPSPKPAFDSKDLEPAEERSIAVTWLIPLEAGQHHIFFAPTEEGARISWSYTIG